MTLQPAPGVLRVRDQRGQTLSEYVMIVGLLSAGLITMTKIIVPWFAFVIVKLVEHMALHLSSPS